MTDVLELITKCLSDEGLEPQVDEAQRSWVVKFNFDGQPRHAILLHPPEDDYVIAASLISSPAVLKDRRVGTLPAGVLATLIAVSSNEGMLAKLTYFESGPSYYATSACSIDGPTGAKLRRRLEACARLAAAIEKELADLPQKKNGAKKRTPKKR